MLGVQAIVLWPCHPEIHSKQISEASVDCCHFRIEKGTKTSNSGKSPNYVGGRAASLHAAVVWADVGAVIEAVAETIAMAVICCG